MFQRASFSLPNRVRYRLLIVVCIGKELVLTEKLFVLAPRHNHEDRC